MKVVLAAPVGKRKVVVKKTTKVVNKPQSKMSVADIVKKLKSASDAYYNSDSPIMSDDDYDALLDKLRALDPKNPFLEDVGAKVKFSKAKLPVKMGSLIKERPGSIGPWLKQVKGSIVVTPKFDGLSGLLEYNNGVLAGVYTRGNGLVGRSITSRVVNIPSIPKKVKFTGKIYVVGEFIVEAAKFSKIKENKYKAARNFAVGMLNSNNNDAKTLSLLKHIDFVAYGLIKSGTEMDKSVQLKMLSDHGFISAFDLWYRKVNLYGKDDTYVTNFLTNCVKTVKSTLGYEADGVVVDVDSGPVAKSMGYESNSLTPKFARAIKLNAADQDAEVGTVKQINWNLTKSGAYKPVLELVTPLNFNGVEVTNVFAHNYANVVKEGLGKGAKVKVVRSGDVIPYIVGVPHKVKPDIPTVCTRCKTKLIHNDVDLYCPNKNCSGKQEHRLYSFFSVLKADALAEGNVQTLQQAGMDVADVLNATVADLVEAGLGKVVAQKVHDGVASIMKTATLPKIMHASNIFSTERTALGTTRLELITDALGEKNVLAGKINESQLQGVAGIGGTAIKIFTERLPEFLKFFAKIKNHYTPKDKQVKASNKLSGMVAVFTGFRDHDLERVIEDNGGKIGSSVTSHTTILFSASSSSTKARKAEALGIKVVPQAMAEKYIRSLIK